MYRQIGKLVYLPVALLSLAAFAWLGWSVFPPPPNKITITSGLPDGMYYQYALRYAEILRTYGLEVAVLESAGSAQNIERLRDTQNPAQVGFVQGGFGLLERSKPSENRTSILTLANIDIEPIWIFSKVKEIDSLAQLQGLRVSIGQVGSGSRMVAIKLLEQVRLAPSDLVVSETTGLGAVKALQTGQIDAALFVAAAGAPVVRAMLEAPGIHLVQLKRSAALTERIPYLEPRLVAQGALNANKTQPPTDMVLLTTVASVVASENLHPALQRLVAAAAKRIHTEAGIFSKSGEFPNLKHIDFPGSADARSTLLQGLPWLEQHLSLRWAQWLWRLLVFGLPIALLAWCVCSFVPAYIRWTIESNINRWYGELKYIENDLETTKQSGLDFSRHGTQLNAIETALARFDAPRDFMKRLFMLRKHIDFVRHKLLAQRAL